MNAPSSTIHRLATGPLAENVYALVSSGTGVLVDPGADAEAILDFIARLGIRVQVIVFTHGHLDHTGALPALLAAWKDAPPNVAIHEADAHYLGERGERTNRGIFESLGASTYFSAYWKRAPEPDILLTDGMILPGTSLQVLHTPGHSAGSICLHDPAAGFLISGDTLFRDGIGRADLPDSDPAALHASLRRLSQLDHDTQVHPGHGEATTIGREFGLP